MRIAKEDGHGVDGEGIRRKVFAGQPIAPGIRDVDVDVIEDEIGHFDPVAQAGLESDLAQKNRDELEREQTFRPDIEGSRDPREIPDEPPEHDVGGFAAQAVNDLVGEAAQDDAEGAPLSGKALQDRAKELDIEGRSTMTADELRDAVAAKETETANPTTDEGLTSEDVTP
jgi:hypothetical protein